MDVSDSYSLVQTTSIDIGNVNRGKIVAVNRPERSIDPLLIGVQNEAVARLVVDSQLSLTSPVAKTARGNNLVYTIVLDHRHLDTIGHRIALASNRGPGVGSGRGHSIVRMSRGEVGSEYWNEE